MFLERKIGIDLTVSSTPKKPSKNCTFFETFRIILNPSSDFDRVGGLGFAFEALCVSLLFIASQSLLVLNC